MFFQYRQLNKIVTIVLSFFIFTLSNACAQNKTLSNIAPVVNTQPRTQTPLVPEDLPQGVTLIEDHLVSQNKVMIPYKKYQLDNGLTVILSPDHSDPLVYVDVTYHVGSAREQLGKSGYAHFFEHMMFEGSEHVASQEHFKLITQAGGELNGSTGRDYTHYYETVPSNELEKVLWLESDRMGFLVKAMTEKKFENQRVTVLNERAQRYDNRPYGLVWEKMDEALFPKGHPYSWQTIGYTADLNRAKIDDLKAFFMRWYGPNNAILTIGGDIDINQTLAWIVKYYATIPKGPEVKSPAKQPVSLMANRYITYEDEITQPMLLMAYPTTYIGDGQEQSLDMLATILGQGKNSLLYQNLVKTGMVSDAGAFHRCSELACTLFVYADLNSGKSTLTQVRDEIISLFSSVKEKGVDQSRLDEIKGQSEAQAIYALQSIAGKVTQLATNQVFYNQPDRLQKNIDAINVVTTDNIEHVFNEFVYKKPCVTLSVVPKGQADKAVAMPNFKVAPREDIPENEPETTQKIWLNRSIHDNFDRNLIPPSGSPVKASLPQIWKASLKNGMKVIGTHYDETPTVNLNLYIPAGHIYEPVAKIGVASLTAQMLMSATKTATEEVIQSQLDKLGSRLSVNLGTYTTAISLTTLSKNLSASLAILQQRLLTPAFNSDDFKRLKSQMLDDIRSDQNQPSVLSSRAVKQVLFGKHTALGFPVQGTLETVKSISLADVKAFYHRYYKPQHAYLTVVGNLDKLQILSELNGLTKIWKGQSQLVSKAPKMPTYKDQNIWLVDKKDAAQTSIHLVRKGLSYDPSGEFYKTQLVNFSLSDNMNSRLMQNLREEKGYTYGIYGKIVGSKDFGYIDIGTDVKAATSVDALKEILDELNKMAHLGQTDQEIAFMRKSIEQRDALGYETPDKKAGLLSQIMFYGLDDNYMQEQQAVTRNVSKEALIHLAEKWFAAKDYQIIMVGDKEKLMPALKLLNKPIQVLNF